MVMAEQAEFQADKAVEEVRAEMPELAHSLPVPLEEGVSSEVVEEVVQPAAGVDLLTLILSL
jgi:hypothetical protein